MNLREEILFILAKDKFGDENKSREEVATEIMQRFGKRIDSEIQNMGSIQVQDEYHVFELLGYGKALEKVKKLLK